MHADHFSNRIIVDLFHREFDSLLGELRTLVSSIPAELLYKPIGSSTVGENILRSAGVLEQTFGGVTASLWDDPFEWTLPESLPTPQHILAYLQEVEDTKARAFASFSEDRVLLQYIELPFDKQARLLELLIKTLIRSSAYRGEAAAIYKMLFASGAHGFII